MLSTGHERSPGRLHQSRRLVGGADSQEEPAIRAPIAAVQSGEAEEIGASSEVTRSPLVADELSCLSRHGVVGETGLDKLPAASVLADVEGADDAVGRHESRDEVADGDLVVDRLLALAPLCSHETGACLEKGIEARPSRHGA